MTRAKLCGKHLIAKLAVAVGLFMLLATTAPGAHAQTLSVLHQFTGGADGAGPMGGLIRDSAGNFYGTASAGGNIAECGGYGCGVVFKVSYLGSGWVETPIYMFQGAPDGAEPSARVVFGPDGALYGTTFYGGTGVCYGGSSLSGCGTVFKLQPPATACRTPLCQWHATILYSFASFADGAFPEAEVTFDRAGNLYGTTTQGGTGSCIGQTGCGTVFELTQNSNGTWTKTTIYSFQSGNDGLSPASDLVIDQAGNLYGTMGRGGDNSCDEGCGFVFEISPSGSGWQVTILHLFTGGSDGAFPSPLTFDSEGNLWGAEAGPIVGSNSQIFELTPQQGGGWNFSVPYIFGNGDGGGGALTFDATGNIYGIGGGSDGLGNVYKLTRSSGGWSYADLYDFDDSTGFAPNGRLVLDPQGNVYGVNRDGPLPSYQYDGNVWEVTP